MKKIMVYEFNDLDKLVRERVINKLTDEQTKDGLAGLETELDNGLITEEGYYNALGCSQFYAESTPAFVPSCFYEKNKKDIDTAVLTLAKSALYTSRGHTIGEGEVIMLEGMIHDRLKCPNCGIPTIKDTNEDITKDEILCNACYEASEHYEGYGLLDDKEHEHLRRVSKVSTTEELKKNFEELARLRFIYHKSEPCWECKLIAKKLGYPI